RVNLYVPWSVMRGDLEPGRKGSESDVVAVLAAVGDIDKDKYSLNDFPIEAPYVIETSQENFQAIYFFERPMRVADARPPLSALSDSIGGDTGTKDESYFKASKNPAQTTYRPPQNRRSFTCRLG